MHIISGTLKNQVILSPEGALTRPTSSRLRESLFNICQGYIEGARFLDLFAGSGAVGLEALSRGASHCTFVDSDRSSTRCIQANLQKMGLVTQGKVIMGNAFAWLERLSKTSRPYSIIYADPPYDASMAEGKERIAFSQRLLTMVDELNLLEKGGMLFIEDSTNFRPQSMALKKLEPVSARRSGRSTLLQFRCLTN